jgi:hypothetical protein
MMPETRSELGSFILIERSGGRLSLIEVDFFRVKPSCCPCRSPEHTFVGIPLTR